MQTLRSGHSLHEAYKRAATAASSTRDSRHLQHDASKAFPRTTENPQGHTLPAACGGHTHASTMARM